MLIKLSGARVFDPTQNWNGEVRDIFMRDGRMVAEPEPGARIDETYSLPGRVIMAGAIDTSSGRGLLRSVFLQSGVRQGWGLLKDFWGKGILLRLLNSTIMIKCSRVYYGVELACRNHPELFEFPFIYSELLCQVAR